MDLNDKMAIVTGAGRGIGTEIALSLSQEGCRVVLVSRTRDELEKVKSEIEQSGGKSLTMAVDISKKHNIDKIIDSTLEEFDTVDILINNAGIHIATPLLEVNEEEWDMVIDINLKAMFFLSQVVFRIKILEASRAFL